MTPSRLAELLLRPVPLTLVCVAALTEIALTVQLMRGAHQQDFAVFYISASVLAKDGNPYKASFPELAAHAPRGFLAEGVAHATDPPTFLLLIKPLAKLSQRPAFWAWSGFNAICLLAALYLLTPGFSRRARLAVVALALLYQPVAVHFVAGQGKFVILLLLVMAIRSLEDGRDRCAGIVIALAGLLRIFPLFLLGYLAMQRRYRALAWSLGTVIAGLLLTSALVGSSTCLSFPNALGLVDSARWNRLIGNVSLRAAAFRGAWYITANPRPPVIIWQSAAALAGFVLLCCAAGLARKASRSPADQWSSLMFWLWVAIAVSPVAWFYDLVLMLPVLTQVVRTVRENRPVSLAVQWSAVAAYAGTYIALQHSSAVVRGASALTAPGFASAAEPLWYASLLIAIVTYSAAGGSCAISEKIPVSGDA